MGGHTATYRQSEARERGRARYGVCDAEDTTAGRAILPVDSPLGDCTYFEVIMRVGRPIWPGARLRHAGYNLPY
jgi:hypothetical protein